MLIDYYTQNIDTACKFDIAGGGSNIGIDLLEKDEIDIAMSSRKLKDEEKNYLYNKSVQVEEVIVAHDALFFIVNSQNPIKNITSQQIRDIYAGKVTDWFDLGGETQPIVKCSRPSSSGTKDFFEEFVLLGEGQDATVKEFKDYNSLLETVQKEKGAIGFTTIGYKIPHVKYLDISVDNGKTYYNVSEMTEITMSNYPFVRPLYLIYQKKSEAKIKPFLNFLKTDAALKIIKDAGFIL
jgi:phosphate transport system substrate-binding protein